MKRLFLGSACVLAACLSSFTRRAEASGFAVPTVGPSDSGVTTLGPNGAFYNPGAVVAKDGPSFVAGASAILGDLRYQRTRRAIYQTPDSLDFSLPIDPQSVDPSKTGRDVAVTARPIGAVPAAFGALRITEALPLTAGLGVYVPYAADVTWDEDGPQRFQLVDATIGMVFFTPTVSYQPFERLSIGAGVSYVLGFANLSKIQDLATLPELGEALGRPPINQANDFGLEADPAVRELDTLARPFVFKNGRAHGVTFSVGAHAELADELVLAASYTHTAKLVFRGDFELDMDDPFFTQDLASQGLQYPTRVKGDASLSFVLPRVVRAGLSYGFGEKVDDRPRMQLALEGSYTGWSSVDDFEMRVVSDGLRQDELGLPPNATFNLARSWRDTFGGLLRGSYGVSPKLRLWLAAGGESGATPDATIDAASPDGTRVTVAGGLSQGVTDSLRVLLDFSVQAVLPRTVEASDYDLANGDYEMRLYMLGAHVAYAL